MFFCIWMRAPIYLYPLPTLHLFENLPPFTSGKAVVACYIHWLLLSFLFSFWQHTQLPGSYQFSNQISNRFYHLFIWICAIAKSQKKGNKETEIEHASKVMSRLLTQSGIRSTWSSPYPTEPPGWPCSSCFFLPYQNTYIHFSHSIRTTGGLALNSNQTRSLDRPSYACMICCVFRCGLQW